jgi:hypothetical protein
MLSVRQKTAHMRKITNMYVETNTYVRDVSIHVCYKVYESHATTNIKIEIVPFMSLVNPRIHPKNNVLVETSNIMFEIEASLRTKIT